MQMVTVLFCGALKIGRYGVINAMLLIKLLYYLEFEGAIAAVIYIKSSQVVCLAEEIMCN